MVIPSSVKIAHNFTVRVVFIASFEDPDKRGEWDMDARTITLRLGMTPTLTLETFLHELMHAVSDFHKVNLPHGCIYKLEAPLRRLLKLNHWI